MKTDILIVGGGLAGLSLAAALQRAGRDYLLLEARHRFGGRVETAHLEGGAFDLGPAWFWPQQPRMAALVAQLGLRAFEQYVQGSMNDEDERGQVIGRPGFAPMAGSLRVEGGLDRLTEGLAAQIPAGRKRTGAAVTAMTQVDQAITATLLDGTCVTARKVVLCVPPRVIAHRITFDPALPDDATTAMENLPTWMAGQAKAVAVYDRPFWRENGMSGTAMSRFGPMVEIHDASTAQGGPYALFGFVGVPPQGRLDESPLRAAVLAQLQRLFGPQAAKPMRLVVKDWARDEYAATLLDQAPMYAHPEYGMPPRLAELWQGAVVLGATEVAPEFGGYLEGALAAAEAAFDKL